MDKHQVECRKKTVERMGYKTFLHDDILKWYIFNRDLFIITNLFLYATKKFAIFALPIGPLERYEQLGDYFVYSDVNVSKFACIRPHACMWTRFTYDQQTEFYICARAIYLKDQLKYEIILYPVIKQMLVSTPSDLVCEIAEFLGFTKKSCVILFKK